MQRARMQNEERRSCELRAFDSDAAPDGFEAPDSIGVIGGYAARYNVLSEQLMTESGHTFRERMAPGCFDAVLSGPHDVRARIDHRVVIGRESSDPPTVRIGTDELGLWYRCWLPDTQPARDLLVQIQRGDIRESSFAFLVGEDGERGMIEDGEVVREVCEVARLVDVSTASVPAYPAATVSQRTMAHVDSWAEMRPKTWRMGLNEARQRLARIGRRG